MMISAVNFKISVSKGAKQFPIISKTPCEVLGRFWKAQRQLLEEG